MVEYAVIKNRLECPLYHHKSADSLFWTSQVFDQAGDKCHGTAQTDDRRSDGGCEKDYGAGE